MIPRAQLDIGPGGLAWAAAQCAIPGSIANVRPFAEQIWPQEGTNVALLSVRTGFDLVLRALDLPAGSEVLLSAVTIPDLPRIVRAHGLVPVPVDIDVDTLAPDQQALTLALSDRSRVLVLAHLFGAWCDFSAALAFAREHGLLVIEDVAQSAGAGRFAGHAESDVRMFSFGPIKTDTALGGAILTFRDSTLAARVRGIEGTYPLQSRWQYMKRVVKFALLRVIATPGGMKLFVRACALAGRSADEVISAGARGFPGAQLLPQIRRRASRPLLAMLAHRLSHPHAPQLRARRAAGRTFSALLGSHVRLPGTATRRHTYWLFPVLVDHPDKLASELRSHGFDATRGATSLTAVDAPPERPETIPHNARAMMDRMLFVPAYPGSHLDRLAALVNRCTRKVEEPAVTV